LETQPWQSELAAALRSPRQLLQRLGLDAHPIAEDCLDDPDFPLRVPEYYVGLMRHGDPGDPLLAQVLSRRAEHASVEGFVSDPVGDLDARQAGGLLRKYQGRALLIATGACAVHCRYCFRRHFPYPNLAARGNWAASIEELRRLDVEELILSGGDPLMLSDRSLHALLASANGVKTLQRLRIHTRLPVVLPSRIGPALLEPFATSRLRSVWVIHANHPNEITPALGAAVRQLRDSGGTVFNQSVLLKSVNDDADTLETLSKRLFEVDVLPYYLHLLDPVAGAAHFAVPEDHARDLYGTLLGRLPGYLVPRLVREVVGAPSKQPLPPSDRPSGDCQRRM
jgi:EF-P beta-lysylation protein EpmB